MKKIIFLLLSIVIIMTGCGAKDVVDDVKDGVNDVKDEVMEEAEDMTDQKPDDTTGLIGEEKARKIALDKAGVTEDGAVFEKIDLEKDDNVWQYEVEFTKDGIEYNAEIAANDGKVLSWDTDNA